MDANVSGIGAKSFLLDALLIWKVFEIFDELSAENIAKKNQEFMFLSGKVTTCKTSK